MNQQFKTIRTIFYLLVVYILSFSSWWAYLLMEKNEEVYESRRTLMEQEHLAKGRDLAALKVSAEYIHLESKHERQMLMIILEGSVFIIILVFGIWRVNQTFFKEMALARQQKNFLLSITHELRSPLAGIKLVLETLMRRKLEPNKAKSLMDNSLHDVDRLDALIDNMLMATKVENPSFQIVHEPFDMSALVKNTSEKTASQYPKRPVVQIEVPDYVEFNGDRTAIASIVSNLVENAYKYSPPDKGVVVQLTEEAHRLVLEVKDEGPGIAHEELPKIFNRFYRIGSEQTRSAKGTGLGLYIVKELVRLHEGKIEVKPNHPCGSNFTIIFPRR